METKTFCLLMQIHQGNGRMSSAHCAQGCRFTSQQTVGRVILCSCKLQANLFEGICLSPVLHALWPHLEITWELLNMKLEKRCSGLRYCRLRLLGASMQGGKTAPGPDMFHLAENKLGGGWNWAIFQSARIQSMRSEASKPVSHMNHPLRHRTTQHNPTALASLSSSSRLWLIMEAPRCRTGGQSKSSYSCNPAPCQHSLAHTQTEKFYLYNANKRDPNAELMLFLSKQKTKQKYISHSDTQITSVIFV